VRKNRKGGLPLANEQIAIEVNSLVKKYGNLTAVDSISFNVRKAEIFAFLGPNGAGKTTTVEILECIREPTSGKARVLGFDILRDEEEIKKQEGVLPQDFNTFDRLTVKENIESARGPSHQYFKPTFMRKVHVMAQELDRCPTVLAF
jgi:ABC-type multidrug transport system ATPase subunit